MAVFAFCLAVALTLGTGPERVSTEIVQTLDLRGEWEGISFDENGMLRKVEMSQGRFIVSSRNSQIKLDGLTDEGKGRFRMDFKRKNFLGIYEQDCDHLVLCFREAKGGRPTTFRCGNGHHLLILFRVVTR